MDADSGGKVALVSGASKGIGRAVAETLAAEGVRLSLRARGVGQLRAVALDLEDKHGGACLAYPTDLTRQRTSSAGCARRSTSWAASTAA